MIGRDILDLARRQGGDNSRDASSRAMWLLTATPTIAVATIGLDPAGVVLAGMAFFPHARARDEDAELRVCACRDLEDATWWLEQVKTSLTTQGWLEVPDVDGL